MESPPGFVHFYGVIGAYRVYQELKRKRTGRPIADQRLRLLVLALLEELIPDASGRRVLPNVEKLAQGLTDPAAPVTYATAEAAHEYPGFRKRIEELCAAPIFGGSRAAKIRELLKPFDEYYQRRAAEADSSQTPKLHFVGRGVVLSPRL